MKRWELLLLQIFAVFCVYLIVAIVPASALEIRIYTSENEQLTTELLEFSDFVDEDFSYPYFGNLQHVKIQLSSKNPSYVIKKIYLFNCKDLGPVQCIENGIQPSVSVNTGSSSFVFDQTFRWNDVSSNKEGNFLIITKLDVGGKEVWKGSWNKVKMVGLELQPPESHDIDRLDLYLKSGIAGETVKSYIDNYYYIPSDRVNHSVLQTISGSSVENVHDLSGNKDDIDPSGTEIPTFYTGTFSGNVFANSMRTWDFVFGSDGKVSNPAVFYSTEAGPPTTSGASLIIDDLSPQIVTCDSDEVIKMSMHVENASSIGYFESYYYEIDGVRGSEGSVTCSITDPVESIYSYECSIPVSNFPVCSAPGTSIITVYFNYQAGIKLSEGFPITLKAPNPKLIVNSVLPIPFDCGLDTELTSQLRVANPMAETPETYYTFDGTNFLPLTCSGSGSSYTCSIPENEVCPLLQESLELTFKLVYGETEVLSLPTDIFVTFPPPSLAIDTVTPQTVEAGELTPVNVLLHVNYPDFISYEEDDFNYKYLNKAFQAATCSLENSYTNIKYYKCTVNLDIPDSEAGVKTLSFRLDGFVSGEPEQLTANAFFEILPPPPDPSLRIIYTSSPVDCLTDDFVTFTIKVENLDLNTISKYELTYDGIEYHTIPCTTEGNLLHCSTPTQPLCDQMKNVLTFIFTIQNSDTYSSDPQKVYFKIPEPHMQVYSIQPNTLSTGEKNSVSVSLFVQYPKMVGDNPVFLYSYSGKANQDMSCTKVSSTSTRDFYECANTEFEIPSDYTKSQLPVLFSIKGTTISFPMNIPVESIEETKPYLEIVSSTPSRIEITAGNQTSVNFYVTVHNAAENNLKHQATLVPNSWISSGTCEEAQIEYDFKCEVTIKTTKTTKPGPNPVTLSLKISNSKTYDISDDTTVHVLPEETQVEIQSMSPNQLYCEGHKQQNPENVKVTAMVKNIATFEVIEEHISFNDLTISHAARYCTSTGQSINCNIPTDKFFEKVNCGSGELAGGEGSHYYPLSLTFIVKVGDELVTVAGSGDLSVAARPLEPYLEIEDNDIADRILQTPINCLDSQRLKLGDTGYVRIMYADLLHPEPKEDLKWSFRLDAHDDQGKLTKGMGVSPEANATVCKFISHQRVGVHRIEDYECSLYLTNKMFQRCAHGEGELLITASAGGKKAEGRIGTIIVRDDSKYQIDMEIVSEPDKEIDCQTQGYGEKAKCSLASYSNQNVTIRLYNRNEEVELADLNLYDFDISLTEGIVEARTLGNCRKDLKNPLKYVCPFQIGPVIDLPKTQEYNITKDYEQTFPPIYLGRVNITVYVKYANNLARDIIPRLDGQITIQPKKSDSQINMEKMMQKMQGTFDSFQKVFKVVVLILSFCATCSIGNELANAVKGTIESLKKVKTEKTITEPIPVPKANDLPENLLDVVPQEHKDSIPSDIREELEETKLTTDDEGTDVGINACSECCLDCMQDPQNDANYCTEYVCNYIIGCVCSGIGGSPNSPEDYQPETGVISFDDEEKGGSAVGVVLAVVLSLVLTALAYSQVSKFSLGGEEETKSDITKNLEKGVKWGVFVCVLPRIIGELGAWAAAKDSSWEKGFEGVAAWGEGWGQACNIVISLTPLVLSFIQFYISYLQFESCMDMVQMSLEMNAQAAAGASNEAYQAQAGAQAGMSMMNNMMSCFNTLMRAMNDLTYTMIYTSNQLKAMGGYGSGQTRVTYYHGGKNVGNVDKLCGKGNLKVEAYNLCKLGMSTQEINIEAPGCPGRGDRKSDNCRRTMMPIYPTYSGGLYGSYYGGPSGSQYTDKIELSMRTDGCADRSTITITVSGVDTRTYTYYEDVSECSSKNE